MSMLLPVQINGVQYQAHAEYTSSQVSDQFQLSLAAFVNIFNLGLDPNISGINLNSPNLADEVRSKIENDPGLATQLLNALVGGTVTKSRNTTSAQDYTALGLLPLAQDGLLVTTDPVLQPGQKYLSVEMAAALDQLIKSLQMAGVSFVPSPGGLSVVSSTINATTVKNWRNLAASSDAIRKIMQYAVDSSQNQNRTLQALVELIYVRTGNELLADSLSGLESALGSTKASLEVLNSLQDMHNKLTAAEKQKFKDRFALGFANPPEASDFLAGGYDNFPGVVKAGDIHFAAIDPTITATITEEDRVQFLGLRTRLVEQIGILSGTTPQPQAGTLVDKLRKVLGDINKAFATVGGSGTASMVSSAIARWILDNYTAGSTGAIAALKVSGLGGGEIQRDLTGAITAGQSVNDTQKEEVRRYLFVFEEYYKSASSILQKITQILERMAQSISR